MCPVGSILAMPWGLDISGLSWGVEGMSYDFESWVCDGSWNDGWCGVDDWKLLAVARWFVQEDSVLCVESSRPAVHWAFEWTWMHGLAKGAKLVVIFLDGFENYMNRHLLKDWMIDGKFLSVGECSDENCKFVVKNRAI